MFNFVTLASANEAYGTEESTPGETLDDDEDEDEEELNASASTDYPEGEGDADESYGDSDGDRQESRTRGRWLRAAASSAPSESGRGHPAWRSVEESNWRRNKRELARRAAPANERRTSSTSSLKSDNYRDEDFAIDDGDEDAWVHDGIDDIHIDPETKRAASELSKDETSSIDSEYEPGGGDSAAHQQKPAVGTPEEGAISEVIPSRAGSSSAGWRARAAGPLLPAAYLSIEQVQALVGQASDARRRSLEGDD